MNQEIATVEEQSMIQTSTLVADGKYAADALMEIVRHTESGGSPIVVNISGNEYLKVEAWEFIGRANNTFAATDNVHAIVDENGDVQAYEAKVNLMKDGFIVGSAIAECGLDSFVTRGVQGRDKHNVAKSMAQTRATSKAFRMSFSWVAVLAGYSPTPAEEMQAVSGGSQQQGGPNTDSEYWCAEHEREWFKRGKMNHYAHPPENDGGEWCNMPKDEDEQGSWPSHVEEPQPPEKPQATRTAPKLPRQMTATGFKSEVDKLEVNDEALLDIFNAEPGVTKVSDAVLSWMKESDKTWQEAHDYVLMAVRPAPPEENQEEMPF